MEPVSPAIEPEQVQKTTASDISEAARAVEEEDWECPCIAKIKQGPCGEPFMAAFKCYVRSTEEEKGMDCIEYFKVMKECMEEHPEAFADDEPAVAASDSSSSESSSSPSSNSESSSSENDASKQEKQESPAEEQDSQ